MNTYHVSGTYKTKAGNIGRVTYAKVKADCFGTALHRALTRLHRRKTYAGGASLTAHPLPAEQ